MSRNNNLRPLMPEKGLSITDMGEYYDALDYVLRSQDIHNVALSGSYGSGKSSVLGSYENRHHEKKFMHVTLARIDEPYTEVDEKGTVINAAANKSSGDQKGNMCDNRGDRIVNILEEKILNQVLHQIQPKNIPLSAFRIKAPASRKRVYSLCAYGVCFTCLLLYHLYFELWSNIVWNLAPGWFTSLLMWTIRPGFRAISAMAFVGVILLGVWILLHVLQRKNSLQKAFKRIDVKGTVGIEMSEDGDESCFDKYLNEVLYLFEHSGADAVVFEDLDRYDVVQIFEKLRVISDLLQQRKVRGISKSDKNCPIPKFIYLIRDSIFSPGERTKFFDLIIPVVPVVASDNAYEKILERFEAMEERKKFSTKLLRNISIYVGDMRLINNIINEYMIYRNQIRDTKLDRDPNLMLSIVVYKNLFPEDFELLRHRRGYVAWVISQREKLITHQTERINEKIEALRQQIEVSQKEHLESVEELNALFFPYNGPVEKIDGTEIEVGISRTALVQALLKAESAGFYEYSLRTARNEWKKIEIKRLRQEMEENSDYQERKKRVQDKQEEQRQEIMAAITDLQNQRSKIAISPLGKLLAEEKFEFWKPGNDAMRSMGIQPGMLSCPEFSLLQYLLQNGYIDENYAVYISYFYPNSLDQWDKNYVLAVHSHRSLGYNYALHDPATVIESIEPSYFADENMWNLSLFDYLVSRDNQTGAQKACLSAWFEGTKRLVNQGEEGFDFILELWGRTKRKDLLASLINRNEPDWFRLWTVKGLLKGAEWRLYVAYTLTASNSLRIVETVDKDHWLSNAVAGDTEFLMTPLPNPSLLHDAFIARSVRLSGLECCPENRSLAKDLYHDNMYRLTPEVLTYLLKTYYGAEQDTALSRSYTYIRQSTKEPLSCYVEMHLDEFVDALADSGMRLNDLPEDELALLNHTKLDKNHKKKYLSLSDTTLKWLKEVTDKELWPELLVGGHMETHWENVADYYCSVAEEGESLPEPLISYIEQGGGALKCSLDDLNQRMGEGKADTLLNDLVACSGLSDSCYQTMWESIGVIFNILPVKDLPVQRIEILIATGTVSMTAKNMDIMQTNYPNQMIVFILSDVDEFIKLASDNSITLEESELSELFRTKRLSVQQEERLLDVFDGTLPVAGKSYHTKTMARILSDHFDSGEAGWFLLNYGKLDSQVADAFTCWAEGTTDTLIKVVEKEKIIPETIYAACLDKITPVQAQNMRMYLPNKDYDYVCCRNKRPYFANTESARIILTYFQKQGWISSWKVWPNGQIQAFSKFIEHHINVVS